MLLAGDVGGTKTRLALYEIKESSLKQVCEERYESGRFSSLEEIVKSFIKEKGAAAPQVACFGVPGPVVNRTVKVTNLPWQLSETAIESALSIERVKLVNDLVATAAAIPAFGADNVETLHAGKPPVGDGVAAVVAPGTGLGQAFLVQEGGRSYFLPSEGGHSNFAPRGELQFELHAFLAKRYGHVSVERVLCGPGLVNIYEFLRDTKKASEPPELEQRLKTEVPAAVIAGSAMEGRTEITKSALDIFVDILGAHASNVMITVLANKGIYLGGGIPPRILPKLRDGTILRSYLDKGKMAHQVEAAPLNVILDDHAALVGAAHIAQSLL